MRQYTAKSNVMEVNGSILCVWLKASAVAACASDLLHWYHKWQLDFTQTVKKKQADIHVHIHASCLIVMSRKFWTARKVDKTRSFNPVFSWNASCSS